MSDLPVLRVENLTREFTASGGLFRPKRRMRAVDNVSFDLPRGSVTGVVGESGCGKSTLARLVLRLLDATDGRVIFQGEDLGSLPPAALRRARRRMQMVFQDPYSAIDPRFTIARAVLEPFQVQGLPLLPAEQAEKAASLLRMVGLDPGLAEKYPHQLSGGQKQRVGIARALALEPSFLVLDEPTASLDVSIQAQIIALLEDLRVRLGLTYLFISHDLGLVRYTCDRIIVMYLGSIVEILPTAQARPRHPYTVALMDSSFAPDPTRRRRVARLSGEIPSAWQRPPGCAFAARCPSASDLCRTTRPTLSADHHPTACHHPSA